MDDLQKHLTTGYAIPIRMLGAVPLGHRRIHEEYRILYPTEAWR
jgi:hypothetical protein